jgi:alpha-tubulin suppressor-like RCC1 family protein
MTEAPSNQVHPEGSNVSKFGTKAALGCAPSDFVSQSNPSAININLNWRIVFFVVIVNVAFSGAVLAIVILRMNSSLEHSSSVSSKSIDQLSANQQTLNATVAQSIANQQTLNATVAQSIASQQTLNATVALFITSQQTLNATVAQSIASQQTLNATVAQSIANQQTLNAAVAQSIASQQTLNATVALSIANQQTLNATVALFITSQQTLNATVALSIANQQTLNASVAQSIANQQTFNYTLNALFVDANTVCINLFDSVSCGCKTGFSGSSFSCSDVNECSLNIHNCNANASCFNTVGSFNCSCTTGFSGNGYACSDIDECASNTHNCISSHFCLNTFGSFYCTYNVISAGNDGNDVSGSHTCALTTSGAAMCWGIGLNGRLGNGATSNSLTPVGVSGMSSGVVAISSGGSHVCALTTSGAAKCWGNGLNGRLGNGASSSHNTPVGVSGMSSGVVAISAGGSHTCALSTSGAAKCWGNGLTGRLGNGATSDSFTPVGVSGMSSGVVAISVGFGHSCALTASGAAMCWGDGGNSQLGNGASSNFLTPVGVSGMSSGVVAISAGFVHSCALTTSGAAKCWGNGGNGRLGNGASNLYNTPVGVSGMSSGVVAISGGNYQTCALTTSGAAKCWGHGAQGQLGNGVTSDFNTPVDVFGMSSGVVAISAGGSFTCAMTASGSAKCWGTGTDGQLGNGVTSNSLTPVIVTNF